MGIISKIIGAALAGIGAVVVFLGMNDPNLSLVYWFIGLIVMSIGFSMITGGRKEVVQEPPPPTVRQSCLVLVSRPRLDCHNSVACH